MIEKLRKLNPELKIYSIRDEQFKKYGKNGTAAGIMNSAASFGIVVQSYGIARIL